MLANGHTKVCTRCREEKPLEAFGKDGGREDGRAIYCKACRRLRYGELCGAGKIVRDGVVIRTPPRTAICAQCGVEYRPWNRAQKYCSNTCKSVSRRKPDARPRNKRPYVSQRMADRQPKPCEHCGEIFAPLTAVSRFCSVRCKAANTVGNVIDTTDGYRWIRVPPGTPGAFKNNYMPEHRWVMQQSLGRPLTKLETVHHINGDKTDNRLENLQLRQGKHGKHAHYRCLDCGSENVEPMGV